jgi:ABC-type transporter Mla maintaining outer membrane lipid asymmetry permease subunit MlaE
MERTVTRNMNWKHFAVAILAAVSIGVVVALVGAFAGLSSRLIAPSPVGLSHR